MMDHSRTFIVPEPDSMVAVKTNQERKLYKHSMEFRTPSAGPGVLGAYIYKGPDETTNDVETGLFPPLQGGPVVLRYARHFATRSTP
jgi:hypothetical protein